MFRLPRSGFDRVPFIRACTLEADGFESTAMICNLSILGVYLHLESPPDRKREVTLRFRLLDDGPEIEAAAVVTWVNDVSPEGVAALPGGCGLRFLRVAPDDLRRIAALIADFLAAPREQMRVGIEQPFTGRVRIPFITTCTLSGKFGTRQGSVCNLSIVGVYVAIGQIPAPGARGRIAIHLPGRGDEFRAEFRVTWQNPDFPKRVHALPPGCGLKFENLGVQEVGQLAALIQDYLQTVAD